MKAGSPSSQRAEAARSLAQNACQQADAAAIAPLAEVRATLAEANENIQMLEKAIITAKQAEAEEASRYKPFAIACLRGDEAEARALLATGLNVNWRNRQGVAALHLAAFGGHTAVVRLLLDQGAEVDPRMGEIHSQLDPYFAGATPWFLAKANKKGAAAELLYSYGADPNATVGSGITWQTVLEVLTKAGGVSIDFSP